MDEFEKYNFRLVETRSEQEANDVVNAVVTDKDYLDWKQRVPLFFKKYKDNWIFEKVIDQDENIIGFVIISKSLEKRELWNEKFLLNKWIKEPISQDFIQFAFFYVHHEERGNGYGHSVIEAIKEKYSKKGYEKMYGFSRYPTVIPLYQKTGAIVLDQSKEGDEIWSYYYWDL
jgi:GNAT superfamily N-acetyltransferase